jgi:hypothetical protein
VRLSATNIRRRLSFGGKVPTLKNFHSGWLWPYFKLFMLVKDKRSSLFVRNVIVEERTFYENRHRLSATFDVVDKSTLTI